MYPWMFQEEHMTITILSTDLLRIQATGDDMIYLSSQRLWINNKKTVCIFFELWQLLMKLCSTNKLHWVRGISFSSSINLLQLLAAIVAASLISH